MLGQSARLQQPHEEVHHFVVEPLAIVQACHFFPIDINALEPCEDLYLVLSDVQSGVDPGIVGDSDQTSDLIGGTKSVIDPRRHSLQCC